MQVREQKNSCLPSEKFKSTLCVLDSSNTEKPHHKVESFHQYSPEERPLKILIEENKVMKMRHNGISRKYVEKI